MASILRPRYLLIAGGTIVCLSTVFGFFGRFFWFFDLFSHFRVQYAISLALIGVPLILAKHYKTAAIFTSFALVNLAVIAPLYFGNRALPENSGPSIRAMLLNVNTRFGDVERVRQLITEVNPDILVLQEINAKWVRDLEQFKVAYPNSKVKPRSDNFGIGLFSKLPIVESEIAYIGDAEVPSILATVETEHGAIQIIATHPPPPAGAAYSQWRNNQLEELANYIPQNQPVILIGDLNTTPWNYYFKQLLNQSKLIDSSQGRGVQATWPSKSPLLLIPLDHFLHSPDIFVTDKKIGGSAGSDHYSIIVDFSIDQKPIKEP
ncbi:endonuclease/exonuclease/phosphatase family protein [Rubellicoccus peritrichatus]|uniref:Endonuclease/exonuclease/phosphatase family protein n=1 Tax=Rubellicoccus peritrichatus TaxID=3080537 RepID=A0AAQ3LBF8_9BACT|nr:endonuclease/exonuclease/phosphatase family protein [Puniceicoccus sp. CR14]WOO43019.1 endonuclease/exonuclease/phosphatase family protein [Puniceicoccus sp. CR14]